MDEAGGEREGMLKGIVLHREESTRSNGSLGFVMDLNILFLKIRDIAWE